MHRSVFARGAANGTRMRYGVARMRKSLRCMAFYVPMDPSDTSFVLPKFLELTLHTCGDLIECANVVIPNMEKQQEMLDLYAQVSTYIPVDLVQGLVWKYIMDENGVALAALLEHLSSYYDELAFIKQAFVDAHVPFNIVS